MSLDLLSYVFLFFVALTAGTVDAVAGGGGLLTLPSLLAVGLPPQLALGTNKFQSCFGTAMASHKFYKSKLLSFHSLPLGLLCVGLGAITGAFLTQKINPTYLQKGIPFLLIVIFLYTLFSPKLGEVDVVHKIPKTLFFVIFGTLLGFYDGFFGPGTGAFWTASLVYFLGFSLKKATAHARILNLQSNVVSALCFIWMSSVDYKIALIMASGGMLGGRFGATLVVKKEASFIRPIFLTMVLLTLLSLVYRNYFF